MTPHDAIQTTLTPLTNVEDVQPAVDFIGEAELALLGEASHGAHEFYASRASITKQLIVQSGFRGIVVEADWPDAYRVNRYVRHEGADQSAIEALDDFKRFPTWMWRNTDVVAFVEWLREHNDGVRAQQRMGFYGMDLYVPETFPTGV
jgi:erythromycin esterase-like protein